MIKAVLAVLILMSTDSRVQGHTAPLESEVLTDPIELRCGAVIKEWRGPTKDLKQVQKLCDLGVKNFHSFIKEKGLKARTGKFSYSLSLIPADSKYRSLNDLKYRFYTRIQKMILSGYTQHGNRYIFTISNQNHPAFDVSLLHELFHAMSHHYGVYDSHKGKNTYEKLCEDEVLATEFTLKLIGKR